MDSKTVIYGAVQHRVIFYRQWRRRFPARSRLAFNANDSASYVFKILIGEVVAKPKFWEQTRITYSDIITFKETKIV